MSTKQHTDPARRALLAIVAAFLPNIASCAETPDENAGTSLEPILNGVIPTKGELESYGVVVLSSGCTGTLVTNQHVLTARHCMRNGDGSLENGQVVTLETASGDITATAGLVVEPLASLPPQASEDYAIIRLTSPLKVNGTSNGFYNRIYPEPDWRLDGWSLLCMGYGATVGATPSSYASGYVLSRAGIEFVDSGKGYLKLSYAGNYSFIGGDSGGPCFFNGFLVSVTSKGQCAQDVDVNNNGVYDGWSECQATDRVKNVAPSAFRSFVENETLAPLTISYDSLPILPPDTATSASVTTTNTVFETAVLGSKTFPRIAARSGRVSVSVQQEPPNTMCPTVVRDSPMSGSAVVQGRCLGDGLLVSLL